MANWLSEYVVILLLFYWNNEMSSMKLTDSWVGGSFSSQLMHIKVSWVKNQIWLWPNIKQWFNWCKTISVMLLASIQFRLTVGWQPIKATKRSKTLLKAETNHHLELVTLNVCVLKLAWLSALIFTVTSDVLH